MFLVKRKGAAGFTVVELLVTVMVFGVVATMASKQFIDTAFLAHDSRAILGTQELSRTIADSLSFDIRMAGVGVPLGQTNFFPGDVAIGDAALPIRTNATATHVEIRLDEYGRVAHLSADYTPQASDLDFVVTDVSNFALGDTVYVSDAITNGENGFRGVIDNISGNTLRVESTYVSSASATFVAGSVVSRVTTVVYDSPADGSGITRDDETGAALLVGEDSSFSLRYLDADLNALTLPLSVVDIANSLAAIEITVNVDSKTPLKTGDFYSASSTLVMVLRNLVINR